MKSSVSAGLALLRAATAAALCLGSPIDTVDLGYAVHRPVLNEAEGYYTFKNIRYADPPTDNLRFQAPVPVATKNRTVQDGSVGFKCPQAYPAWALLEKAAKAGVTPEELHQSILNDPLVNEDCLFLDVVVTQAVFDGADEEQAAPVLVWLHGGGYDFGSKDDDVYNPSGLIARSKSGGSRGVIYVAVNYRLGLFGFLNGNGDEALLPNAGLHDQRLALNWVQEYIHLFGGDKNQVTVMGQSGGAGSIIHHITAEGGNTAVPFSRAIIQSPGWEYINKQSVWDRVLATAGEIANTEVSSGADLAALDFTELNQLNGALIFGSPNGSFTFSPTVDGEYVPDYPNNLLNQGRFDPDVELLIGHNANEAGVFVSPEVDTEEKLRHGLEHAFAEFRPGAIEYVLTELYPPPGETDLYATEYERACLIVAESSFVCNTRALATAFGNQTYNYRFDVPPALHMQDIPWTFYRGNDSAVTPEIAEMMQAYFTVFSRKGSPNPEHGFPEWLVYGEDANILTFGAEGVGNSVDDARNRRCDFWQSGVYRKK